MKNLKEYIIYFLLGFITLCFISCDKEIKYDLEKDNCGSIVVQKEIKKIEFKNDIGYLDDEVYITYSGKYLILKDSIYKTIILPKYYNYKLGDTICSCNDSLSYYRTKLKKSNILLKEEKDYNNYLMKKYGY